MQMFRFEVKHVSGMGARSPPRGGAAVGAANQQFLADSDEEAADDRQADANAEAQPSQKASKKRKVSPKLTNGDGALRVGQIIESSAFQIQIAMQWMRSCGRCIALLVFSNTRAHLFFTQAAAHYCQAYISN